MDSVRHHQRRGATLLEAVMIVLVLAAGASATLMTLDGDMPSRRQVRAETIAVSRLLNNARSTAMESRCTVRVEQRQRNGQTELTITREAGPLLPRQVWTAALAEGVQLRGHPQEIQFRADGSANRALSWDVTTGRSSGIVTVSPITGQSQHTVP